MASAFGHALAAITLGSGFKKSMRNWKFWLIGIICSILPDADVISFKFGNAYGDFWGHRGFTHSLLFALILGILVTLLFFKVKWNKAGTYLHILYFSFCTASHAFLDAFTSGGLGVAFFSPWDNDRYFFPWRPIKVSPIGASNFFSEWGMNVLKSEAIWIGIPCVLLFILFILLRRRSNS